MDLKKLNRRSFVGGVATALGYVSLSARELAASQRGGRGGQAPAGGQQQQPAVPYDQMAKLANNENPYGPSQATLKAMQDAFKYANRYGYPDGGIVQAIAAHHGVTPNHVMISAGSAEILKIVPDAFLKHQKIVVGPDPTYLSVYSAATNSQNAGDVIRVPLTKTQDTDMQGIIRATKNNYRNVGLVYICNPNNPTGKVVPKQDIKLLLDSIPGDVPVLIDEAYHHFAVDNPEYEESIKYVKEGRNVIVARTFSKIAALAAMRLGYAVAPPELINRMRPVALTSINVLVKYAGVAALKDTAYEAQMRKLNAEQRDRMIAELKTLGYDVIPSHANFFMVNLKKQAGPVRQALATKGILVGRDFPPMLEWLRVSVGDANENQRFITGFKEIMGPATSSSAAGNGN
ncbi:MAG: aminotransferase class I/II-fold pyridoxal phosphate-dependent enzyme [Acidobacteria bacterium]|nr:aminotransferase class I/II-fold pyridoxal phosphate-dependent enzyme [Acidobacteriota bacterium]